MSSEPAGPDAGRAAVRPGWMPPGYCAPLLVVLSGPSGVGKTTVLRRIRALGLPYSIGVTATTRPPRPGEQDGIDYRFVSEASFQEMLGRDELLEHAVVHRLYHYGIPRASVRNALASGRDVIVPPEVQGAATVRDKVPGAVTIFLAAPTFADLERRIRDPGRKSTEEEIHRRLATARQEMAQMRDFDYLVINEEGRVDETVRAIDAIIQAEKRRVNRPPISV